MRSSSDQRSGEPRNGNAPAVARGGVLPDMARGTHMTYTTRLSRDEIHGAVREHLAAEVLELEARVQSLEADVLIYRLWFQESLHALAAVTRERDQARRSIRQMSILTPSVRRRTRSG